MLTLLSQQNGASIEEMMQATYWQQHSVHGFLAGTVKKKLVFSDIIEAQRRRSIASKRGARADMEKAAIDIVKSLARLSELSVFELRGEWRRLHRMLIGCRRRCGSPAIS